MQFDHLEKVLINIHSQAMQYLFFIGLEGRGVKASCHWQWFAPHKYIDKTPQLVLLQ